MTLIYLLAGEPSGDTLGARLMAALRKARPELRFAGVGGPQMAAEGLTSLFAMQDLAVMGLMEVLPRLRLLRHRLHQTIADIQERRPDVVVTIDTPAFALRLLKAIRPFGIPRAHYVAPQVWAWRESRVRRFPGLWERLLCLLPFEPDYFAAHGLPARFVGHPVLESGADRGNAARFRARHGLAQEIPVLVLMAGSRRNEIGRLLPIYARTLALLAAKLPSLRSVMPVPPQLAATVREATRNWPSAPLIFTELEEKHDAYAAAAAALTKSGTSTLELALAGVPMAVTYRVNALSGAIARRLISVPHVAMVNLLAGKEVVPELLQQNCTPDRLAAALWELLTNPAAQAAQRGAFRAVVQSLRPAEGMPSEAAARAVLELLQKP